jgi:hypothetical protein
LSATPAGQERLAAYYRDKAEHLRAKGAGIRGTGGLSRDAACNH